MKYSNNLVLNPGAETGTLEHWQASNVEITSNGTQGTKSFKLNPGAIMRQVNDYLAFVVHPAQFAAEIAFKYLSSAQGSRVKVRAFYTIVIKYLNAGEDTFMLPLDPTGPADTWITNSATFAIRENEIITGYDITISSDITSQIVIVDNISLKSGVEGLDAHEIDPNPHNLPLAITVGQHGIKATKGEQVMFWLKDNGDAIYNGRVEAAQITVGTIDNARLDILGMDLLSNPTFSSYASNVDNLNATTNTQATLIQQNASQISLQASSLTTLSNTVISNNAAINIRADGISSDVSSVSRSLDSTNSIVSSHSSSISQLSNNINLKVSSGDVINMLNINTSGLQINASNIDLTGITTVYSPNKISDTRMTGTGITISSRAYQGAPAHSYIIAWDGFISYELGRGITTIFPDVVKFSQVDFSAATVSGLTLKFA